MKTINSVDQLFKVEFKRRNGKRRVATAYKKKKKREKKGSIVFSILQTIENLLKHALQAAV